MSDARRVVNSERAARPDLPLSHAVAHGGVLYVGGQAGIDPDTRTVVADAFEPQFVQAMANLSAVAEAGGSGLEHALKMTVYVRDLGRYDELNTLYSRYFDAAPPARKVVCCPLLPGLEVEVDAILAIPEAD